MTMLAKLMQPQFLALKKQTEAELYEPDSIEEVWKFNAIRGILKTEMSGNPNDLYYDLISLHDIIKYDQSSNEELIESYIMVNQHSSESSDSRSRNKHYDRTLVVKRTNLLFNDKECLVLNF